MDTGLILSRAIATEFNLVLSVRAYQFDRERQDIKVPGMGMQIYYEPQAYVDYQAHVSQEPAETFDWERYGSVAVLTCPAAPERLTDVKWLLETKYDVKSVIGELMEIDGQSSLAARAAANQHVCEQAQAVGIALEYGKPEILKNLPRPQHDHLKNARDELSHVASDFKHLGWRAAAADIGHAAAEVLRSLEKNLLKGGRD